MGMANGDEDTGLSLSPDLQGYVTGQNQLFPPPQPAPTLASTSGFDLAFGDSIATQQHNHGMWGSPGIPYNAKNPAPFKIWETNAVGDPTSRVLDRANWLLDQNPDYFTGKNVFLSANANSPNDTASFGRLLDTLKEAKVGNVVVPGLGPGIKNQSVVNATIQRMVEQRGFTYFEPNMTRGWDSAQQIHPNYPPEMTSQAMAALAQARRAAAEGQERDTTPPAPTPASGTVPVSEGQYGSANLRPGYQSAPSGFNVSTTPGSQDQQPIAPTQYASAGGSTAPVVGEPTNLLAPASPPLRYNWNPLGAVPRSQLNQPAYPYSPLTTPIPSAAGLGPSAAEAGTVPLPDVSVRAPANTLASGLPPVGTDTSHEIWTMGPGSTVNARQQEADLNLLNKTIYERETSSGRNITVSTAGARGPMQIMPGTFKQYAKAGEDIDKFSDNMAVGQRIIADLYRKYGNSPAGMDAVLVGYNAGEKYVGKPWNQLPAETRDYILKSHKDWGITTPYQPWVAGQTGAPMMQAASGLYQGDVVPGTNYAIGGRLAFAPPPQMFTGPEAPRQAGSPVAQAGQGGGPAGDTKEQQDARDAARLRAAAALRPRNNQTGLNGYQMLALAAALAVPKIPRNTYDPRSALPKEPPPGTGRMPIERTVYQPPIGGNTVPGYLPYQNVRR